MTTEITPTPAIRGLSATVADLRCRLRRDGARDLLGKLAARARSALYSREEVVILRKDLSQITAMSAPESVQVKDLEARHLPAIYEFNRRRCHSKADARSAAALTSGYRGFVGFVGAELVGYYWWVDAEIEPNHSDIGRYDLDIELGPGDVYGYDFYMLEEHRGGGKATEFLHKVETGLRDRGYRTLWGYVVADNRPARWLYGLRGYASVGKVVSRRVLGRRTSNQMVAS